MTHARRSLCIAPFAVAICVAGFSCSEPEQGFNGGDDDDSGAGGDDDDTTGAAHDCPNTWAGFGDDPDPDSWDMVVLYAIGGDDFDIGERDLGSYGLQIVQWNDTNQEYGVARNVGLCFLDGGGIFHGSEQDYGGAFYSVSQELTGDDGWAGHVQVIPVDGSTPHLLGAPGTLRGLAIVPDGSGGFVICGSTSEGGANALLWVDATGDEVIEHALPDGGSCYDVGEAWDGTFWVTDPATGRLLNFDLEAGEFYVHADLPHGDLDYVVDEAANGQVMVGADNILWVVDAITGEVDEWMVLADTGITTNHVTNFHWSHGQGTLSWSVVMRDYPSAGHYGPYTTYAKGGPNGDGLDFWFWEPSALEGAVILDYALLGELE